MSIGQEHVSIMATSSRFTMISSWCNSVMKLRHYCTII